MSQSLSTGTQLSGSLRCTWAYYQVYGLLPTRNPCSNVQRDTEGKLKRACSHSERESEPTAGKQQRERRDKRRMPPPPNLLETTEQIDDATRRQHRSRAEEPTGETRSLLQMIREQIVSDVEADTASTGLEIEAEHWQRKEAAAARRYTRALELRAQLAEEAMG
jgi:hypothetical protein